MAARPGRSGSMATTRAASGTLASLLLASVTAHAACGNEPRLHALDFWLGRWDVTAGGEPSGRNDIDAILGGCAVTEHWLDVRGGAGLSLFWYDCSADRWKQVWVTEHALSPGGAKEKAEVRELTSPTQIRFQGRYPGRTPGVVIEDRTTLTREAPDRVHQLIEVSTDGGMTWASVFDAEYRRAD
jgi:hypothetical protein